MGKKPRKGKGKGKCNVSHKARMQERRERQLQEKEVDHVESDVSGVDNVDEENERDYVREFFPDDEFDIEDRVFFVGTDGCHNRGGIKERKCGQDGNETFDIMPFEPRSSTPSKIQSGIAKTCLMGRDTAPWYPKFATGDLVIALVGESEFFDPLRRDAKFGYIRYELAKVTPWPTLHDSNRNWIYTSGELPYWYSLDVLDPCSMMPAGTIRFVSHEDPSCIRKYCAPRFHIGDKVIVSEILEPTGVGDNCNDGKPVRKLWKNAVVKAVDACLGFASYFVYLVEVRPSDMRRGSEKSPPIERRVLEDTDEYIASIDSTLRDRFLESIEQDCSDSHFSYLMESGLDVAAIRDLVLQRAIKCASYNALSWLIRNFKLNPYQLINEEGLPLLHQLAQTSRIERFFEQECNPLHRSKEMRGLWLPLHRSGETSLPPLFDQRDQGGQTWMHRLIHHGHYHAVGRLLSSVSGIGLHISAKCCNSLLDPQNTGGKVGALQIESYFDASTRDNKGVGLIRAVVDIRRYDLAIALDEFSYWCTVATLMSLVQCPIDYNKLSSTCLERLARFDARWIVRRIMMLCSAKAAYRPERNPFHLLSNIVRESKCSDTVQWFLGGLPDSQAKEYLLRQKFTIWSSEDQGEFRQPELIPFQKFGQRWEDMTLTLYSICYLYDLAIWADDMDTLANYFLVLRDAKNVDDFVATVVREAEHAWDFRTRRLFCSKKELLTDNDYIKTKLKTVDYLVRICRLPPPNVIDIIRLRIFAALRWLVDMSHIHLDDNASLNSSIQERSYMLAFLHHQHIPSIMTVGELLCFVTIEYDDFQSLRWLLDVKPSLGKSQCMGWALVHACAYFGRFEIFQFILSHIPACQASIGLPSCRRGLTEKQYAVHIAVVNGYTNLANALIAAGCPQIDGMGVSATTYAKKSKYGFVRQWGEEKEQPLRLDSNIRRLYQLIENYRGNDELRRHILESRCMDMVHWADDCGYTAEDVGPLGKSYAQVLADTISIYDEELISWLLGCCFIPCRFGDLKGQNDRQWQLFWGQLDSRRKLLDIDSCFINGILLEDDDVWSWCLRKTWRKFHCVLDRGGHLMEKMTPYLNRSTLACDALKFFCMRYNRLLLLSEASTWLQHHMDNILKEGADISDIKRVCQSYVSVHAVLAREYKVNSDNNWSIINPNGAVRLIQGMILHYYPREHIFWMQRFLIEEAPAEVLSIPMTWSIEGHVHLMDYFLTPGRAEWNIESNHGLELVRTASFFRHRELVDILLKDDRATVALKLPPAERAWAALLGAVEGCHLRDADQYWNLVGSLLPEGTELGQGDMAFVTPEDPTQTDSSSIPGGKRDSLLGSCLFGWLGCGKADSLEMMSWISKKTGLTMNDLLREFLSDHEMLCRGTFIPRYIALLELLIDVGKVELWAYASQMREVCETVIYVVGEDGGIGAKGNACALVERLLQMASLTGVDIQNFKDWLMRRVEEDVLKLILRLQTEQKERWGAFGIFARGNVFDSVRIAFETGELDLYSRDEYGLRVVHRAAAFDHVDVLRWLVEEKGASLETKDVKGRTVLEVAISSDAMQSVAWIRDRDARRVIGKFVTTNFLRRRARSRYCRRLWLIQSLQAIYRGWIVRRLHGCRLSNRLDTVAMFKSVWGPTLHAVGVAVQSSPQGFSWSLTKQQVCDMTALRDDFNSLSVAETVSEQDQCSDDEADTDLERKASIEDEAPILYYEKPKAEKVIIQLTKYAQKWRERCDPLLREIFVSKLQRLSSGDRSRTLTKRLKGTTKAIYESYLEQKSGHRILWTEHQNSGIVVWFVEPHDRVSRKAALIDDADKRTSRQLVLALDSSCKIGAIGHEKDGQVANDQILLDPLGNVPLKLYTVPSDDIMKLIDVEWKPPLRLTPHERKIVETDGTVLILGRSGTGKTVCISNRMSYDQRRSTTAISQLFVSRSIGLCSHVEACVGIDSKHNTDGNSSARFQTYIALLKHLEKQLDELGSQSGADKANHWRRSQQMTYHRFARELHSPSCSVHPFIVWAHIRSFVKGSVETVQNGHPMSREKYLQLGKKVCRLEHAQREAVYAEFERYEKYASSLGLWDDCDRVHTLLQRINKLRKRSFDDFQRLRFDKIYVDEVQDFTQCEITLFFMLCGPGNLFLAGDPAQSVVEGVEFRFEDVRSVGYHLFGAENRHLIPDKPHIVNVNYRSHSGILNVAAEILGRLFDAFPDSAKQLKVDRGLFVGPRPGVLDRVEIMAIQQLLDRVEDIRVLTHDDEKAFWMERLNGYPFVYGIREAKGLEFQSVLLLDFFGDQEKRLEKPWQDLFLNRDIHGIKELYPEIEGQLKLLYTAVTRCISRLYFAESTSTKASKAFVRWVTDAKSPRNGNDSSRVGNDYRLATRMDVNDVESMVMTVDEWRTSGLDSAMVTESAEDSAAAVQALERSLYCFERIGDSELGRKARAHLASVRYRGRLEKPSTDVAVTDLEDEGSKIVSALIAEGLWKEACLVCEMLLPHIANDDAREMLQKELIDKIPAHKYD